MSSCLPTQSFARSAALRAPHFLVEIQDHTLVAPSCVLTGCHIGRLCYVTTNAIILQGARIDNGSLVRVGAIVHFDTHLPENSRVGLGQLAVPGKTGPIITAGVTEARDLLQATDFSREHSECIERQHHFMKK